jgi:hypothetical protein
MSSNEQEDISLGSFGDTPSSSGSAMLKTDSPKIAGGEKSDKEKEALVILEKATEEEYPITDTRVSILRSLALSKPILKRAELNKPAKNLTPPGTAVRRSDEPDKKPKKKTEEQNDP